MSPIAAFKPNGGTYAPGEAPSFHRLLFPTLSSVRLYDPVRPVVAVTNFELNATDLEEVRRMGVQSWAHPEAEWSSVCPGTAVVFEKYNEACAISTPHSSGVYLLRYYQLRCAMEQLRHDMIFFVEGDNVMAESIDSIVRKIGLTGYGFDATHSHVSLHASFMSFEFVEALTRFVADLMAFGAEKTGRCAINGPGQDMRISYYAAAEMHMSRLVRGIRSPVKVLNGATVGPCKLFGRPWEDNIGPWCRSSGETTWHAAPCALQKLIDDFERLPANSRRAERARRALNLSSAGMLPLLYECRRDKEEPCAPWDFQTNLNQARLTQSPGTCRSKLMLRAPPNSCFSDLFVTPSKVFRCPASWAVDPFKELVFGDGRAFVLTRPLANPYRGGYIQQFNLHFQGGGCKVSMKPAFQALQRSKHQGSWFTCGFTKSPRAYDHCLATGEGAVTMPRMPLCGSAPLPGRH